jgi:CRP/FNR family transcriptional regulator, cyclic AMP receptor protein
MVVMRLQNVKFMGQLKQFKPLQQTPPMGTVRRMPVDSTIEHLAGVRLFSSLSKKELGVVAKASKAAKVAAGTEIITEGTTGDEMYLIIRGAASVLRGGRYVTTLTSGSYFGELALLDHGPRTATVVADTDCDLVVIGRREFMGVLDEVPAVAQKLLINMAGRLREAETRGTYWSSGSAYEMS